MISQVDWQAVKARVIAEAKQDAHSKNARPGASKSVTTPPTPSWMAGHDQRCLHWHLHVASSASWKDAQGLHFDEWIE